MKSTSLAWVRTLLAVAVAAAVALPGAPASAAPGDADLALTLDQASGLVRKAPAHPRLTVTNRGPAAATGVRVTLNLTEFNDRVTVEVSAGCSRAGDVVTCPVGQLAAGATAELLPLTLTRVSDDDVGEVGAMIVAVAGDQPDPSPGDNDYRFPVAVMPIAAEPRALVADLGTAARRVRPGDRAGVYAAVRNAGDAPLTEFRVRIDLPTGAVHTERYRDCSYTSNTPNGGGDGYAYTPTGVECHLSLTLQPGETLPLFDPATRRSLFGVVFGRNLPGPDKLEAYFTAFEEADPGRPDNGTGPSFAEAVRRLGIIGPGEEPAGWPQLNGDQGITRFWVSTAPNTFDIAVTKPAVSRNDKDVYAVQFTLLDNGPSDSGAVEYVITAPKGTVLFQYGQDSCQTVGQPGSLPESAALRCVTPSPFTTVHSGLPPSERVVFLRVKSRPGGGGKITVRGVGVGSTESKWSNNSVPIVLDTTTPGTPGGGGGGGGGLPITGAPAALVAGAGGLAVVLGVALLMLTRRRKVG